MIKFGEKFSARTRKIISVAALLLTGAVIGGAVVAGFRPIPAMAPAAPQTIAAAISATGTTFVDPIVTIRGEVMALYGNNFTIKDVSGQALVRMGRSRGLSSQAGQAGLVKTGQTVTVQGRMDQGVVHARFIVTPDGRAWALAGGRGGRHHGRNGDHRNVAPVSISTAAPIAQ